MLYHGKGTVPTVDGNREVERGYDADHSKGVPLFDERMSWSFRRQDSALEHP